MSLPYLHPYLGLSNGLNTIHASALAGWDVDDDFTSYADQTAFDTAYVSTSTAEIRGNPTDNDIDWTIDGGVAGNMEFMYYDLMGAVVDDTAWVLRQPIVTTAIATISSPYNHNFLFGLSDDNTSYMSSAQDFIGTMGHSSDSTKIWYAIDTDEAVPGDQSIGGTAFATTWTTGTIYNEVIRTSATTFTTELFSDSGYSTSIEQEAPSVASTCDNLRYWKIGSWDNTTSGVHTGRIDPSLQFADGVTVAP